MKLCTVCDIELTKDNWKSYHKDKGYYVCYDCAMKRQRGWHHKNTYRITTEDYNKMFQKQNGCCAICKVHTKELKRGLHIDHNHKTNEVRGLLCHRCNTALGLLDESIEILFECIEYLRKVD